MISSMTGYGRGNYEIEAREYTVEIKSVNHRYSDVSVKIPRSISYLEEWIKKEVQEHITRGKVDVFVTYLNNSDVGKEAKINKDLAKMYIEALTELTEETNIRNDISTMSIARLPDVLEIQTRDDEELIKRELKNALEEALEQFVKMRQTEGEKLTQDLQKRLKEISKKVDDISQNSTGLIEQYVVKLEERVKELLKTDVVDQNRIVQEVVLFADKCSVEEEVTRLKSHISQMTELLNSQQEKAIGKRLDFLVQEMNRETNTIGSKANSLAITNLVVDVKTELENIREQIQNIE